MQIIRIADRPQLRQQAAAWFHEKWGIPLAAYLESMDACIRKTDVVPQWYLATEGSMILGGLGVIENDFHDRKDLRPNVCAVYVEAACRCQGIAGRLLQFVCQDMARQGIDTLYLLTDHIGFYERYGWRFYGMVQADGEDALSRMYVHQMDTGEAEFQQT